MEEEIITPDPEVPEPKPEVKEPVQEPPAPTPPEPQVPEPKPEQKFSPRDGFSQRRQIAKLEAKLDELSKMLQQRNDPVQKPLSNEELDKMYLEKGPTSTIQAMIEEALRRERESIPKYVEKSREQERLDRAWKDAEDLVYNHELSKSDPNFKDNLLMLAKEEMIDLERDPLKAFQKLVNLYSEKMKSGTGAGLKNVPTKSQVSVANSGTPPKSVGPDISKLVDKMARELEKNPDLASNKEWFEKYEKILEEAEKAA